MPNINTQDDVYIDDRIRKPKKKIMNQQIHANNIAIYK